MLTRPTGTLRPALPKWPVVVAVLLSGCADLSPSERYAVDSWLTCDECMEGERDSLRAIGMRALGSLSAALRGPDQSELASMERQLRRDYERLPNPSGDAASYAQSFIDSYSTVYRMRAATALGDIGELNPEARDTLQLALDSATVRGYTPDVVRAIQRAISNAADTVTWVAVAAGLNHSCGLAAWGAAYCWGDNGFGQLGDDTFDGSATPMAVFGAPLFDSVVAGWVHSCGLMVNALARCWGNGRMGQLGRGDTTSSSRPRTAALGLHLASVTTGGLHTCGDSLGVSVYCWGANDYGQLGGGFRSGRELLPTKVTGGIDLVSLNAGAQHTCGLTASGDAYCWGANSEGELGDNASIGNWLEEPFPVPGGLRYEQISAGGFHSCGLTSAGDLYCWGANAQGQLGNGSNLSSVDPVAVSGVGQPFRAVSLGGRHSCAITTDDEAYCWGDNTWGQLGDNSTDNRNVPTQVNTPLKFSTLSAGPQHTCGVTMFGHIYCWGRNDSGELGDGSGVAQSLTPVRVSEPPSP